MSTRRKPVYKLALGLAYITPNLLGFLTFTLIPLIFSLFLAFSNWDLRMHNMFVREPVRFVGLEQFRILLDGANEDFWRFLGNTLFLMMGIPVSIVGSLLSAILLSQDFHVGTGRRRVYLLAGGLLVAACVVLSMVGAGATGMVILIGGLICLVLVGGLSVGSTFYRTLFYLPHFTAGVATFLLWKKLYSPQNGPINAVLAPVLVALGDFVQMLPSGADNVLLWASRLVMLLLLAWGLGMARKQWSQGEWGSGATLLALPFMLLPAILIVSWGEGTMIDRYYPWLAVALLAWQAINAWCAERMYCPAGESIGNALLVGCLVMVGQFILLGLGNVGYHLPAMAEDGLSPPQWLTDYYWAKPAIIIMSVWAAIGSNNMLLYLAGLSNVPVELQEAADIDGATRFQRFWHVTWPQLAPVTFFIVIMSVMGGLQGGFEMARSMTAGGPAGSTTTLSYFVYTEAFMNGRMGYASAIAWVLFVMVFTITLFNWKFGSRYVND